MIFPLIIVALLGTVFCHGSRNLNSSSANANYGNVQYANAQNGNTQYANAEYGKGPLPYSRINQVSADTEYFINPNTFSNVTVRAGDADCKDIGIDFGITVIQAAVYLNGKWCSPAENDEWSLTLESKLKIIGIELVNDQLTFSPRHSEVRRSVHVGLAKADIRLGVYDYCIKIIGEACYWAVKWRCADIYEVPHCFKSQNFYSTYLRSNAVQFKDGGDCPSRMRQIAALAHTEF